ncbi:MAG TPA: Imm52 family immunity protein [Mycobacterium sp.]|nr:Imm52 family immunity protein [Mycobacterium sp.]
MSKAYVGAYWGARAASVDDCADTLAQLLDRLSAIDPLLTGWRDLGKSKQNALQQLIVRNDRTELLQHLERSRSEPPIDGLGYSLQRWNGAEDPRAAINLSFICGNTSGRVTNAVVTRLCDSQSAPGLYAINTAKRLVESLIGVSNPDWAVLTTNELVDKQSEPPQQLENGGYKVGQLIGHPAGWATYLGAADSVRFNPALLPDDATVDDVGSGVLVVLGGEPNSPRLNDVLAVRTSMGYDVPADAYDTAESGTAEREEPSVERGALSRPSGQSQGPGDSEGSARPAT